LVLVVTCEHVECGNFRIDMCHRLPIGVKNGLKNKSGFSTICCTLHAVRRREANLIVWRTLFWKFVCGNSSFGRSMQWWRQCSCCHADVYGMQTMMKLLIWKLLSPSLLQCIQGGLKNTLSDVHPTTCEMCVVLIPFHFCKCSHEILWVVGQTSCNTVACGWCEADNWSLARTAPSTIAVKYSGEISWCNLCVCLLE
jgi:hypothetical protein